MSLIAGRVLCPYYESAMNLKIRCASGMSCAVLCMQFYDQRMRIRYLAQICSTPKYKLCPIARVHALMEKEREP